jgi:hypothetical protein
MNLAGEPKWALATPLKHRSGHGWGELIAVQADDISFQHRVIQVLTGSRAGPPGVRALPQACSGASRGEDKA